MVKLIPVREGLWKVQRRVLSTPPLNWVVLGIVTFVGGIVISWVLFPMLLRKTVMDRMSLAEGQDTRRLWIQSPPLTFNIYLFNITNPAGVMVGEKPIVEEVGPYCFKEVKEKLNIVEDYESDTISYRTRSTWYQNQLGPECGAPHLTGDEVVTVANVPLLSILLIAEKDYPESFLLLVNEALPHIFGRLKDVFTRTSARKLMFEGITIDCSSPFLLAKTVCNSLRKNGRTLKMISKVEFSYSLFGAKNGTLEDSRYTVKRGTRDSQEVGRLVAVNNSTRLPFWRGDCNMLQGTDATIIPPFRQRENGSFTAYTSEVCRTIVGVYEGDYDFKGVTGYTFSATFGNTGRPEDRCFCPDDNRCYKEGALDTFKCQGAPLVSSLPHFYRSSSDYLNGVVGLHPDKDKHGIVLVLEPISGVPLIGKKRLQMSIDLKPVRFVPVTQDLKRTMLPVFWVEEVLELDDDLVELLQASLFRPIKIVNVFVWLLLVLGLLSILIAVFLKFHNSQRNKVHTFKGVVDNRDASGKDSKVVRY